MINEKPIIIGIAGGSGSGKTSIANYISEVYKDSKSVTIIREDDYYNDLSSLTYEERSKINFDHPLAFEHNLLISNLKDLVNLRPINKPIYDYTVHNRSKETEYIEPSDVIIVEGLFVLENKEVRDLLDMKLFVDTASDVRFIRRLLRDVKERQRTIDSVIDQYTKTVRIMHEEFIEPSKKYADIIIPEGKSNKVALDLIITKINSIIG